MVVLTYIVLIVALELTTPRPGRGHTIDGTRNEKKVKHSLKKKKGTEEVEKNNRVERE